MKSKPLVETKVEKIPIFGIGGDGSYIVSPNGLPNGLPNDKSKYRIRMKFKVDPENITVNMVLVNINNFNRGSLMISLSEDGSGMMLRVRSIEEIDTTQLALNDGNWHYLDFFFFLLGEMTIIVDGKQTVSKQSLAGPHIPTSVVIGGAIRGYTSFQGKIKEVYFGDVLKTDMFYQYKNDAGNGGGEITYEQLK